MDVTRPLTGQQARKLAREILGSAGVVLFSGHAMEEMRKDAMTKDDVFNLMRGAQTVTEDGFTGAWRYRFETQRMATVIAFQSDARAIVVTAWRKRI